MRDPLPLTWTDHRLVCFTLTSFTSNNQYSLECEDRRNWRKVSPEFMGPELQETVPLLIGDPNQDVCAFNDRITSALGKVAPIKTMVFA